MEKNLGFRFSIKASVAVLWMAAAVAVEAQPALNVISWNLDDFSTINPTDVAGLVPASNWVDTYLNNVTTALPDNSGAPTTMDLGYASVNTWHIQGYHPGYDQDGTANRELLNGYLNSGPAAWNPPITNSYVSFTNVPYAQYDVVVYFSSDTSGRHGSVDDGSTTYYFSTMGSAEISGANATFKPTTETDSSQFPSADFAFFPGLTTPNRVITVDPKSGNDQWLGIAGFQVIQASNVYVLYGPIPATQTVEQGAKASFSVMVGGLNPAVQWRHDGTNIPNATNLTYTIDAAVAGQEGNYDVVVTNSFSSVTSSVAVLTSFYTPKDLRWAGAGSTWDTTSANWTTNGGSSLVPFTQTDNVRFDSLGLAQPMVSLSGAMSPGSITVSNASYILTSGTIEGSGGLNLVNNAALVLDTTDNRTGPTTINSGSLLQVGNGAATGVLGSGALTNNGALLFYLSTDQAYGLPVYGNGNITNLCSAGTITLGSDVSANYLTMAGAGSLLLQGSNHFTGGLVVSSGQVWARSAGSLGNAPATVNAGGELQLIYSFDFGGSPVTLAGGLLHGVGGAGTLEGQVTLTADSEIAVDSGYSLTLNNAAGLAGNGYNLTVSGGGTLTLAGADNTWAGVVVDGTLQIGNGGTNGSLGGGLIQANGTLTFNTAGNLTVTNIITGLGTLNQNGSGTAVLTADNSLNGFTGLINVTNGTLLVNGTSGYGTVTVAGGALGGTGTIDGPVYVMAGGTLAPGDSVGTLTLNGGLNLQGNLSIDVDKSLSPSNDVAVVSPIGSLLNIGTGTVTVNNLGPALKVGDTFKLFNQPMFGGESLTISTAGGVVWSNHLATDGAISVTAITALPHPVITGTLVDNSGNLVFQGTNGVAGGRYYVLTSTSLATPLADWTVATTNSFDANGSFSVTNSVDRNEPQRFYLLQLP